MLCVLILCGSGYGWGLKLTMKKGIVKFSKEFVTPIGLKEWVGIEIEYDMSSECPRDVLTNAKEIINGWHSLNNPASHTSGYPNLLNPEELPVINAAEERIGIEIENATTKEELIKHKDSLSTHYLADLYSTKLFQLNKINASPK